MSDASAIEILGGGAVAVDTVTLRDTAARFEVAAIGLDDVRETVSRLGVLLHTERDHATDAAAAASALFARLTEVSAEAARIASLLREAAVVYELVELNVLHRSALFSGDVAEMHRIDALRDAIIREHPDAMDVARELEAGRAVMWPAHLVRQSTELGQDVGGLFGGVGGVIGGVGVGGFVLGAAATAGVAGWGRVSRDARLTGEVQPVAVRAVPVALPAAGAPRTLEQAAMRIPQDSAARVRVEAYTMPDGTRQYAVYVPGTRSGSWGGEDPWDMRSNRELYSGERSASYEATVAALEAAGAGPGDTVHAFGHSQGAMITAHLALEGGYDTQTLVSYGSPVDADVGPDTLSVSIRHTDDPVTALAGGGHMGAVGAPGSFAAEREAHPVATIADLQAPAHTLDGYAQTAALVDASSDPRVEAVREVFAGLDGAVAVEVTEYAAERLDQPAVSPSSGGGSVRRPS